MLDPEEKHLEPYRRAVERFGPTFEATLWHSEDAQALRFEVMIEMVGVVALDGCRILDIGCGRGDLAKRLLDHDIAFEHYIGLDALPEMIEAARARNLPRCDFEVANVLADLNILKSLPPSAFRSSPRAESREPTAPPDFAFISGTLNTMDEAAAKRIVRAALDAAAQGVVFNFLSNRFHPRWTDQPLGPAKRYNTVEWLDWSLRQSPRVSFTQDYLDGHDATILIRHG